MTARCFGLEGPYVTFFHERRPFVANPYVCIACKRSDLPAESKRLAGPPLGTTRPRRFAKCATEDKHRVSPGDKRVFVVFDGIVRVNRHFVRLVERVHGKALRWRIGRGLDAVHAVDSKGRLVGIVMPVHGPEIDRDILSKSVTLPPPVKRMVWRRDGGWELVR